MSTKSLNWETLLFHCMVRSRLAKDIYALPLQRGKMYHYLHILVGIHVSPGIFEEMMSNLMEGLKLAHTNLVIY